MPTFAIATLGCKVNNYESEGYEETLLGKGYEEVSFKEKADIYIINTCTVTNSAASKSRQKIHTAHKMNPNAIIVVVGCYVQTSSEDMELMDYIDILVGSDGKSKLVEQIESLVAGESITNRINDARITSVFEALPIKEYRNQTRAFLKVQDGCNQFCSYCIIPFARGRERSLAEEEVIKIAKDLVSNHHSEIVLTGIHTGRYGLDIHTNLVSLIKRLQQIEGLDRIRLSSIEITEVSDELLMLMKEDFRVARHLHIPLQSGSNTVLKRMNRPYTVEDFKERIDQIREYIPDISISTDLIAGFVGETEEEFEETIQTIKDVKFSFIHVFPYSKREGTQAVSLQGHLNNKIKKTRVNTVLSLSKELLEEYQKSWIGKIVDVIVETYEDGKIQGHSSEYLMVSALGDYAKEVKVQITGMKEDYLIGEVIR